MRVCISQISVQAIFTHSPSNNSKKADNKCVYAYLHVDGKRGQDNLLKCQT